MSSLPNIRRAIGAMRWAIVPEKLEAMIEVLELRIAKGSRLSSEEIEERRHSGLIAPPRRHAAARTSAAPAGGKVAVLPLTGLIMPKAAMVNGESLPAGTSCEQFAAMFDAAVSDPGISAIVIDVDSPGGSVSGIPELAARMLSARGAKPIVAVANGLAASAAYWLATAADELVVAPSGEVGSIGVFCVHAEGEEYFAKEGIRHTIIKAGEFKAEGNPYERLSEEAQAAIQSDIDTFYGMFVGAVARNRGVGVATVEKNFGRGRCVLAKMAVASGMADRVGTLESVLRRFGVTGVGNSPSRAAATSFRASEDVSTATAPIFAVGDRVRSLVEHMPGMTGMVGTVTTANAGSPPYYGVTFDGETEEHKWLAEDEIESADEKKEGAEMKMAASAVIGVATVSGAIATITASAGVAAAPVLSLHESQPAPQGQEYIVQPETATASPSGAVTNTPDPVAVERGRVMEINALCLEHGVDATLASSMIGRGVTVDAAAKEILQAKRAEARSAPRITGGADRAAHKPWASFGEQLIAIKDAYSPGGQVDVRLAAAQGMNQGVPSEGGLAVAPQFSQNIWDGLAADQNSLLSMSDNYTIEQESLTFLANAETSRATGSRFGGVRGYWINEADQITKSTPKLRNVKIEPQQMAVMVYVTEKLLRNSPVALQQFVQRAATEEIAFLSGDAIMNGTGAGQPKGILASAATVSVAKETNQAALTINQFNISKMWARLHPRSRANAVWLHNVDIEPQLDTLSTVVQNVAGTENVGGYANKVFDAERRTLKGRPIMASEFCPTLGTAGDLCLVDMKGYLSGTRGGIETALSIHVRFEYAEQAFRFIYELDGQPWLAAPQTPFKGSNTLSTFVSLATRA